MRTVSAPHRALIGGQTLEYHLRVEIRNESGTWIDYTNDPVAGEDWVDELTLAERIDDPIVSGNLRLKREIENGVNILSLAPFRGDSELNVDDLAAYSPVIHPGRECRIWIAPVAAGAGRPIDASSDWKKIFDGILGKPQWGPDHSIDVILRGMGAILADTIIEEEREYGSSTIAINVADVIQQILNDNGLGAVTLVVPSLVDWYLEPYVQARVPVLEAIRALALQAGHDLRYRYSAAGTVPELTLYLPDRNPTFTNLVNGIVITADEYLKVTDMQIGDDEVRNFGRLLYIDAATGVQGEVTGQRLASIDTYGRRYIEIGEDHTSNIDSEEEAQTMLDFVLDDLETPFADHAIETFHLWPVQLHDLIHFTANDKHYNDDQEYAVVGLSHRFAKGHAESTIQTRGKPAGAYRTWINMHGSGPRGPAGVPAPVFTFLLGEHSHGGGVTGDGGAWLGVRFDKNTAFVLIYGNEGADDRTATPGASENLLCCKIDRPDGDIAAADNWETIIMIATRPDRWRKIRAFGVGYTGLKGPDWIPPAVQAVDPVPTPIDGTISLFTINPVAVSSKNVIHVTPGTIDPAGNNFIAIRRDEVDLIQRFIDASTSAQVIEDTGINPNAKHTYEAYIWNNGVSGKHRRHGVGIPATPDFDWANGAPRLIFDSGTGKHLVSLEWAIAGGAHPTADHIIFEYGKNGVNFPSEIGQTSVLSTLFTDLNTRAKWYRMRLEDAANAILAYSSPAYFAGTGLPPSWGAAAPPQWNPIPSAVILRSPTLSIGIPSLVIGHITPTSGAVECVLQSAPDVAGSPGTWSDTTYKSGRLAGEQWNIGPGIGPQWFRLAARTALGGTLATSSPEFWVGFVTP